MKLAGHKVLVLAPHTDDETLCAATIWHAREAGATVFVRAFSDCVESIPKGRRSDTLRREFQRSMDVLGISPGNWRIAKYKVRRFNERRQDILEDMVHMARKLEPTIVLCPSTLDRHQDHTTIREEAERAFRNCPLLLGYENPHNQRSSTTNLIVEVTPEALEMKCRAWNQYESQRFRSYFDEEFLRSLAKIRGAQARVKTGLAEAFEVISMTARLP